MDFVGVFLIAVLVIFSCYMLWLLIKYYNNVHSRSERRVILSRGITNLILIITVIIIIIMNLIEMDYWYGVLAFIVIAILGGILSFVLDMLA
jgi:low temperature requirement protein LtrA